MSLDNSEKSSSEPKVRRRRDRAAEVADTFEWLITAFILAFVFRAFVMEAFRIPTGSMADTLKGAHFRLRCKQCGYKYEYGFNPGKYRLPEDTVPGPGSDLRPYPSRCPSCGNYQQVGGRIPVANGDRILVLKCIYQFLPPKRWDVIVFKNPPEPEINYIKRLIGLPGETVQIIDGDIYVNGQISRKPPKVQEELWTPVYDNDYQPVHWSRLSFNHHAWEQPFKNKNSSKWEVYKDSPTLFHLDSPAGQINTMEYSTSIGNDFRATYAYDDVQDYSGMPYCSDLMVRFYCLISEPEGTIGISLSKYETTYRAKVSFSSGIFVLTKQEKGKEPVELMGISIKRPGMNKHTLVKFANVDHQLIFQFGSEKLTYDLGCSLEDAGRIRTAIHPRVEISGSGKLTLSHVAVFRDIHYTTSKYANGPENGRAIDKPFTLDQDEYFVLGDNSPNSEDCRWWTREGLANKGLSPYRVGIVPRDYLVGKALFVYWPSGFRPFPTFPIGIIPNIGRMRFIYGGSNEKL